MSLRTQDTGIKREVQQFVENLQDRMCKSLEQLDGDARFVEKRWQRDEGGGGRTRALANGAVFEKAAVNISAVWGILPESMASKFEVNSQHFFATGLSSIIHPQNPFVPALHTNYRYFELEHGDAWFGGGIDLTPYYPFIEDVRDYHRCLKQACDRNGSDYYQRFKSWCDEYFYLKHRGETRGVGGLFFDYLRGDLRQLFSFVTDCSQTFFDAYLPIVEKRRASDFGEKERYWQLLRRGRYVEFNLLYDRGTKFGLETGGQIESILLSMPPLVRWDYDVVPEVGSRERELLDFLKPRDWLELGV